jgi:hypothetical protein
MTEEDKIYEVKKDISVDSVMQLIDLNGTSPNFQSDFVISMKDPSQNILVCVVNQDELDNGDIKFEKSEGGKYARRVTFCENKHLNHFIACKKNPSDKSENNIECNVVVHLKRLPLKKVDPPPTPPPTPQLKSDIDQQTRDDLQKQLLALSQSEKYRDAPPDVPLQVREPLPYYRNPYLIIGVICLAAFCYLLYKKKFRS